MEWFKVPTLRVFSASSFCRCATSWPPICTTGCNSSIGLPTRRGRSTLFGRLANLTTLFANSGNHDLDARRDHGEKAATWLDRLHPRVATHGQSRRLGNDLVSVCAWWEGPVTLADVERQLAADTTHRDGVGAWIWVYHSPPGEWPTSWSGSRHFGDDVLNRLALEYQPEGPSGVVCQVVGRRNRSARVARSWRKAIW